MNVGSLQRATARAGQGTGGRKSKPEPGAEDHIAAVFGEYLARELRARNWTIRALALRSGVDHTTISRLIHGQRVPTLRTASRLNEALEGPHPGPVPALAISGGPTDPVQRVAVALSADPSLSTWARAEVLRYYVDVRTSGGEDAAPPTTTDEDGTSRQ